METSTGGLSTHVIRLKLASSDDGRDGFLSSQRPLCSAVRERAEAGAYTRCKSKYPPRPNGQSVPSLSLPRERVRIPVLVGAKRVNRMHLVNGAIVNGI